MLILMNEVQRGWELTQGHTAGYSWRPGLLLLTLPLPEALLRVKHLQFPYAMNVLPPLRGGKTLIGSLFFEWGGGRGKSRMGRAQSLFAIPAFTLFSSHAFLTPPSYCNSLLKYLRTVSCLQAPWSLQREELIEIQINKFHLKWEDAVLVYNA